MDEDIYLDIKNEGVLASKDLLIKFSIQPQKLKNIIERLVESKKIKVIQMRNGDIKYEAAFSTHMENILEYINNNAERGVSLKQIKFYAKINNVKLNNALKNLEEQKKIKTYKSTKSNQKLYTIFDYVLNNNIWIDNGDIDIDLVCNTMKLIEKYFEKRNVANASAENILDFLNGSKIFDFKFKYEDIIKILELMKYDNILYNFKGEYFLIKN